MGSHAFFVLKMTKYVYYIPILNVTEINIYFFLILWTYSCVLHIEFNAAHELGPSDSFF